MFPSANSIANFSPASSSMQDPGSSPAKRPRAQQLYHVVAHNFHKAIGSKIVLVTPVPVARLVSMLDCEHSPGSRYAIVSKCVSSGRYATTVLDVPLRKVYRAMHDTGMATFWRGLGQRRAGFVDYVAAQQSYDPANYQPPGPKKRPNLAAEAYRVALAERAALDSKFGPCKRMTPRKMPTTS